FTIGEPGSVKFQGAPSKARVNPAGLVDITGQMLEEQLRLALDTGSPVSLLDGEQLAKWHVAHPAWPYLKGAVGAANVSGTPDEADRELLRVADLHVGTAALSGIAFASLPPAGL